jgi:hypothetical protein
MKYIEKRQVSIGIIVEGREKLASELEDSKDRVLWWVEIVTVVIIYKTTRPRGSVNLNLHAPT